VVISNVNPHDGVQILREGSRLSAVGRGRAPRGSEVQVEGSAGQVLVPGIRMLHPGLGPAPSLPSLESAISVSAVQGAVPSSQPEVPSIKLLD